MSTHKFPYLWNVADGYPAKGVDYHGCKVFGTFICGGGSSMGYKLAGYNHLGGVELDPSVAQCYKVNHHPELLYIEDIRDFNKRTDLPSILYDLDLLDGSPPCSTFSTAGDREKAWGKEKHFAEGQKLQTLDDLVFVYCDTIEKLKPKVCLLENVSGLIKGNAKSYTKRIVQRLDAIGYDVQVFLLNASFMGVPQKRERVFFIGHKKEYNLPRLQLQFNEDPIVFGEFMEKDKVYNDLTDYKFQLWKQRRPTDKSFSDIAMRVYKKESDYQSQIIRADKVPFTLDTGALIKHILYDIPRHPTEKEFKCIGTFPQDYNPVSKNLGWLIGMSVPPVMTAQIADQIYRQWLIKLT